MLDVDQGPPGAAPGALQSGDIGLERWIVAVQLLVETIEAVLHIHHEEHGVPRQRVGHDEPLPSDDSFTARLCLAGTDVPCPQSLRDRQRFCTPWIHREHSVVARATSAYRAARPNTARVCSVSSR